MAAAAVLDADLYDWAGTADEEGAALVEAARPGYRQVVEELRSQILSGAFPPGSTLPAQAALARDLRVDVTVINRAVTAMAAEGLVRVEHGKATVVLLRQTWRIEFGLQAAEKVASLTTALRREAKALPAVRGTEAIRVADGATVRMTVESADISGAVMVALVLARQVMNSADIVSVSATGA